MCWASRFRAKKSISSAGRQPPVVAAAASFPSKAMEHLMTNTEPPSTSRKPVLRDQQRALHAYQAVGSVRTAQQKDYQIAVNDLGANILRSGLCAAIASVQRLGDRGNVLLDHLAAAGVPGLDGVTARELPRRVRELDAAGYMIATREILQIAMWLKRAVQATFEEV
jgi:CRISPR-associated protein Cmr5